MKDNLFELDIKKYPVGKTTIEHVDFPSFYGLQDVKAPIYINRATEQTSPCLVVTACVHGDETNGHRIAQALMKSKIKLKKGTLIIVPIVNIYGFLNKLRYLPDRKDLNRCFPGSTKGSFGSRFANFIFTELSRVGDYFIDLHSGGPGRFNVAQIRADLNSAGMNELVQNISIPLVVNSALRDGSFRQALTDKGIPCIVFEGGEGLRINETITKYGLNLIKSMLKYLDMTDSKSSYPKEKLIIKKTRWMRAKEGGVLLNKAHHGKVVKKAEVVGELRDTSGNLLTKIKMEKDGVILGMSQSAMIMAGDALYNIGLINDNEVDSSEDEFFDYFDFEME